MSQVRGEFAQAPPGERQSIAAFYCVENYAECAHTKFWDDNVHKMFQDLLMLGAMGLGGAGAAEGEVAAATGVAGAARAEVEAETAAGAQKFVKSDDGLLEAAERARDAAGLKPDGTPNRESPVYVGGYDAEGNVMGTGNGPRGSGVHAEDRIQEQMPGAQMTEPYAWRRNADAGELEWKPFTVCTVCQGKYPPTLFPPGTRGAPGGAWGE